MGQKMKGIFIVMAQRTQTLVCMVMAPPAYLFLSLTIFLLSSAWVAATASRHADPKADQNVIKFLPGFQGPLPFYLETGYVGVGDFNEFQLFYYFVESEQNPKEDPLLLWLTGGGHCSGLASLLLYFGPLAINKVKYNGSLPTLKLNQYSYTKASNIIFLDSPVGVGFSYARGIQDYEMGDIRASKLAHKFLRKWLANHPQFLSNPIYIGGVSYTGKLVPVLTLDILNGNEDGLVPPLNIQGYVLGNPATDPRFDLNSVIPFVHGMGLISDELFEGAKIVCKGDYINVENHQCMLAVEAIDKCISRITREHILEPFCNTSASPKPKLRGEHTKFLLETYEDNTVPDFSCTDYTNVLLDYWANDYSVRQALHVREGTIRDWMRCNHGPQYTKDVASAIEYHINITRRGYRAFIYSGDHDMVVPFVGTQAWIRSLNYSIADDWRAWFVDGQVAGYTRLYSNNLTFTTVKGGGHSTPLYRPKECLEMLQRWFSHAPL